METELKVIKAENNRLRHALEANGSDPGDRNLIVPQSPTKNKVSDEGEQLVRLKEAFVALKNVTVSQEKSLYQMRAKAQERRKELREKDAKISSLKKKVDTMQKIQLCLAKAKCPDTLQNELEEMQEAFFDEQNMTTKLKLELLEKEKTIMSLKSVLQAKVKASKRENELNSKLTQHGSEIKKELRRKTQKIVELQSDLEVALEKLHEARLAAAKVYNPKASAVEPSESQISESEFIEGNGLDETEYREGDDLEVTMNDGEDFDEDEFAYAEYDPSTGHDDPTRIQEYKNSPREEVDDVFEVGVDRTNERLDSVSEEDGTVDAPETPAQEEEFTRKLDPVSDDENSGVYDDDGYSEDGRSINEENEGSEGDPGTYELDAVSVGQGTIDSDDCYVD